MLSDEQYEAIGNAVAPIFQRLEKWVISDIARRLKKMGKWTATAKIQAAALRLLGYSQARIQQAVEKKLNADKGYQAALAKETSAYQQGLKQRVHEALNEAEKAVQMVIPLAAEADSAGLGSASSSTEGTARLRQIVDAAVKNAGDDLKNLSKTTAFKVGGANTPAARAFQKAVDEALMQTISGATTIDEAVRRTVNELAANGMRTVTYTESGKKIVTQTDVAVRRCLQTTAARMNGQRVMEQCRAMGVNYVEVSKHWGARTDGSGGHTDHQAWQGKVYQIEGASDAYQNLEAATGYPSDMLGLLGYNCRHSMYPFWPGISTPNQWQAEPAPIEYRGKVYTYYEATQKMRALERKIRAEKRIAYADKALGSQRIMAVRLNGMKDEYRAFCKAMGIRPAWNRTTVEGETADFKEIFKKD